MVLTKRHGDMARNETGPKIAGVSDEAVRARSGRGWRGWIRLLNRAGAAKMSHKEIASYLYRKHGLSAWWSQMVTVGYEQATGRRLPHQTSRGFQASVSRTLPVPLGALSSAWEDAGARERWLGRKRLVIRKTTPGKSMRMTWADGTSSVEVCFYSAGARKSRVVVQHSRPTSATDVRQSKAFWSKALTALAGQLGR
jgi:hypothetical protein